ncbi:MAG: response regulator, partial [Pirellulales bacterium]
EPPGLPRRDKPAGSPSLDTTTYRPKLPPESASNALLDAVFTMLGSDDGDGPQPDSTEVGSPPTPPVDDDPPWVLSIDDDADYSDALKCRLETCGVAVVRAFSGMEGYRLAFAHPASAILLDYNMPDGQGDYILGRLSDNPVTRNIPVIVITGVRDKSLERKMYGLGAKRFLTKPVPFETLRDELAKYIEILAVPTA